MNHQFKKLEIWKLSREFCSEIYKATSHFPESEKFGITNQLRRASVSIPSNIAEGTSRKSNKDFSRFLDIALGSAFEIETQLLISYDLNFLNEVQSTELNQRINRISKMISVLRNNIQSKLP